MEPILSLPPAQFRAALAELNLPRDRADALRRQYRLQNSPLAGLYGLLDRAGRGEEGMEAATFLPVSRPEGMSVADAIRSGEAGIAVPQGLLDAVGGVARALDAPSAAAAGLIPSEDMVGEALGTAGMAMGAGGLLTRPEDSLGMGARVRDPRLYHPASNTKLNQPVDEMRFGVDEAAGARLGEATNVTLEDLYGRVLTPAFGDRTRAGGLLYSIMDEDLARPVELQGGADFMRSEGGIWASEPDAMRTRFRAIERMADEEGEEPVLAYTAMGAQAGDFSRMMSDAMMGQIRPSMANYIDPDVVARYDARIRDTVDPEWPGILSENAATYVDSMTGSNRRLLWQEMDRAAYRSAGFPDVGQTRLAITDPRLIDAQPFDTGLTFGSVDVGAGVTPTPRDVHATYGAQIHGNYIGGLPQQVPGDLIWRDFFNARRQAGASTASDQRAFMMTPSIRQRVDDQMIDLVSRYLAGLRQ